MIEMTKVAEPPTKSALREKLRIAMEVSVAGVCCVMLALTGLFFCVTLLTGKTAGTRDFVVYWATGQQFAQHGNPYDKAALSRLERSAGLPPEYGVMYMRNPPWTLPITLPLGFFGVRTASFLWSLLLVACLAASVQMLWVMCGSPGNRLHFLGYSFAPAILCLMFGQTSLFALLGLVLFLRLHERRPALAGMSLWLCALKPHLFVPFGVVLLAWAFVSRSYKLLAGAAVAMGASCVIVYLIDPTAWLQYAQMMHASGVVDREYIPCLTVVMRLWLNPSAIWLQYLPTAFGCLWALSYFWLRRNEWSWRNDGSLLMLVSLLVAPYSWLFDQALVIPALFQGIYLTKSRNLLLTLALASALIEVAIYCDIWFPLALYRWTLWTAPVWLVWYFLACRSVPANGSSRGRLPWQARAL
jgi:hypothetical protein